MKQIKQIIFLLILFFLVFTITCTKEFEFDNPYDANTPSNIWMPDSLDYFIETESILKLTWIQKETRIDGFKIDKKYDDEWHYEYDIINKEKRKWRDSAFVCNIENPIKYRLYAFALENTSDQLKVNIKIEPSVPLVTTDLITELTEFTANVISNISSDGCASVTERGVCWSTSENPTIEDNKTTDGNGIGEFTSNLTELIPGATYYVRAYATNSVGTSYGNQISFNSFALPPTLTTTSVSDVTATTAISGGNVTSDGGAPITVRGVCWSTSENPTTDDYKTEDGSGTGSFTSNITGLNAETTYYVRAYATNSAGTSYGEQISFTTEVVERPIVVTNNVSSVSSTSAFGGGNVTSDGGAPVTARGVCWSTSQGPTISNSHTTDGTGTGSFTSDIEGLVPYTTYYVRAYAENSAGIRYGNQISFTTGGFCAGISPPSGYGLVESSGRCWLDRNLGASQVATSSTDSDAYGDLYQWGRGTDGHQIRTSGTTSTLSSSNTPGHGNFILAPDSPRDWRSPQNDNLWQGVNGVNNPCPPGWRIPTEEEWEAERQSWSSNNAAGAFASPLRLPVAGYRSSSLGSLGGVGSYVYYWSSTVSVTYAGLLYFDNSNAIIYSSYRSFGRSVRCIKE